VDRPVRAGRRHPLLRHRQGAPALGVARAARFARAARADRAGRLQRRVQPGGPARDAPPPGRAHAVGRADARRAGHRCALGSAPDPPSRSAPPAAAARRRPSRSVAPAPFVGASDLRTADGGRGRRCRRRPRSRPHRSPGTCRSRLRRRPGRCRGHDPRRSCRPRVRAGRAVFRWKSRMPRSAHPRCGQAGNPPKPCRRLSLPSRRGSPPVGSPPAGRPPVGRPPVGASQGCPTHRRPSPTRARPCGPGPVGPPPAPARGSPGQPAPAHGARPARGRRWRAPWSLTAPGRLEVPRHCAP
jgi:hypothetical protein